MATSNLPAPVLQTLPVAGEQPNLLPLVEDGGSCGGGSCSV